MLTVDSIKFFLFLFLHEMCNKKKIIICVIITVVVVFFNLKQTDKW